MSDWAVNYNWKSKKYYNHAAGLVTNLTFLCIMIYKIAKGSYCKRNGIGTAAWCIKSACQNDFIEGKLTSPGQRELQSTFRSKLVGQLA